MNKPKELQTTTQIIAREGFKPVGICIVLMLLFIFLHLEFLALIALICAIFCAFIFRNTERITSYRSKDALIAPCDGIIKDIYTHDSTTAILFKINIFDSGIFRVPAYITHIKSIFRFGLFIKSDKNLQKILNTKHKVSGFLGDLQVFSITLLPELWNKANIYELDSKNNSSLRGSEATEAIQRNNIDCRDSALPNLAMTKNNTESITKSADSAIFIGDRLGFMKYGYLLLEIHAPCKLVAQRGDNLFAGESLIGKFQANLY